MHIWSCPSLHDTLLLGASCWSNKSKKENAICLWTSHSQCLCSLTDPTKSLRKRGKLRAFWTRLWKQTSVWREAGIRPWSSALHQSYHSHSRLEFPQALARIRWLPDASYSLSFWLASRENCSLSQFYLKVDCAWRLTLTLLNTGLNKKDKSILSWWIA